MKLKTVQIELGPEEARRVLAIGLDGSAGDALAFVKDILYKKVEKALQDH